MDSNRLHHFKPCSNHSTESHYGHLTSRQMKDKHSPHSTQLKLNIIKMKRLVQQLKTTGLSITTKHKNSILKHEGLGNKLMHATSVY
jgi:histone acetyltransferase (RNA polymerase elongator complex component)